MNANPIVYVVKIECTTRLEMIEFARKLMGDIEDAHPASVLNPANAQIISVKKA